MNTPKEKKALMWGMILLSAVFLSLRSRTVGHILMWDEAWNILSLRAYLLDAVKDPFYWFYYFHPPLYMVPARFLEPFSQGIDIRMELLSLLFSYSTFLCVYGISARLGGWRYAWISGLALSVMPSSIAYDTWIKRDGLASMFGYLALLLLLRKRFFWVGVSLALAMLSKENGLFFLAAAIVMVLISGEGRKVRDLCMIVLPVVLLSSWWYVFFSEMTTHGIAFFFSRMEYSLTWDRSPLYYFTKLLPDMGPVLLSLAAIGLPYCLYLYRRERSPGWLMPAVVFLCVYVPLSVFFVLKAPWLALPARPALAMLAGAGMLFLVRSSADIRVLRLLLTALVFFLFYEGFSFSYNDYHAETYPNGWPGALSSYSTAMFLNENMEHGDSVIISDFEYWDMPICPVFLYYWKGKKLSLTDKKETAPRLLARTEGQNTDWLVIFVSPERPEGNIRKVLSVRDITGTSPRGIKWSYVWDLRSYKDPR